MKKIFSPGELVTPNIAARLWDEEIIEAIGSFRYEEIGVVVRISDCDNYVWVLTGRGKTGWVLQTLIDHTGNN